MKLEAEKENKRIKEMEKELNEMVPEKREIADTVNRGKKGKKTLGICVVRGDEDLTKTNRRRARLRERKGRQEIALAKIEIAIIEAEEYINSIEDSEIRMLMREYFIEGKTWEKVAEEMGEGYSACACKKKVQRYINREEENKLC